MCIDIFMIITRPSCNTTTILLMQYVHVTTTITTQSKAPTDQLSGTTGRSVEREIRNGQGRNNGGFLQQFQRSIVLPNVDRHEGKFGAITDLVFYIYLRLYQTTLSLHTYLGTHHMV